MDLPSLSTPPETLAPDASPPAPPTAGDRPSAVASPPAPEATRGPSARAPGIRRFLVVEPQFAAGSAPSEVGWAWLAEQGYKTVVDVREAGEVRQDDLAAINRAGLRLISLPMSARDLDPAKVKAFEAQIALQDARPVYVFDADGLRPASLAFLHLVLVKKMDKRSAEREVEDLGGGDSAFWKSALAYLSTQPSPTASTPASSPDGRGPGASSSTSTLSQSSEDATAPGGVIASSATPR